MTTLESLDICSYHECMEPIFSPIHSICEFHKEMWREGIVHQIAKQIICQELYLTIPDPKTNLPKQVYFEKAELEYPVTSENGNSRVDVLLTSETGKKLYVEVSVLYTLSNKRIKILRDQDISSIELNLAHYYFQKNWVESMEKKDVMPTRSDFVKEICNTPENYTWIYNHIAIGLPYKPHKIPEYSNFGRKIPKYKFGKKSKNWKLNQRSYLEFRLKQLDQKTA